jgi:hypothetical protein
VIHADSFVCMLLDVKLTHECVNSQFILDSLLHFCMKDNVLLAVRMTVMMIL